MTTQEIIKNIKNCGQSLIDNAESIAGDYKYQTDLDIRITIPVTGEWPEIEVSTVFLPEKAVGTIVK